MGKTPKPLKILLVGAESLFEALQTKGHTVDFLPSLAEYDLILGPTCARFLPGMEKFLDALIKGARKAKYPVKVKS